MGGEEQPHETPGSIKCLVFLRCRSYGLQEDCHRYTGGPQATSPRRGPPCQSSSTPTSTTGLQRPSRSQPHEVSVRRDRVPGHGFPPGPVGVKLLSSLVGGVQTRPVRSTPSRSLQQSRIFSGTMADISSFTVEPACSARYPLDRCLPRLLKAELACNSSTTCLFEGTIVACTTSTPSLDIKIKERATSWQVPPILYI